MLEWLTIIYSGVVFDVIFTLLSVLDTLYIICMATLPLNGRGIQPSICNASMKYNDSPKVYALIINSSRDNVYRLSNYT